MLHFDLPKGPPKSWVPFVHNYALGVAAGYLDLRPDAVGRHLEAERLAGSINAAAPSVTAFIRWVKDAVEQLDVDAN
ncbi:hypothetical protein GCM10010862_38140 [Devosia nitrariae]|uniref:Uncharacterized protein n=1 Tax=Devosia nitrariae TaxID=2071872 RepID=A0ABQ5W8W5_9HYPH|nr:hypothetical protein GCM10010862_38140 [Devosia nitrariae]